MNVLPFPPLVKGAEMVTHWFQSLGLLFSFSGRQYSYPEPQGTGLLSITLPRARRGVLLPQWVWGWKLSIRPERIILELKA